MQRARAGPAALAALARPVAASPGMWNPYNATAGDTIFLVDGALSPIAIVMAVVGACALMQLVMLVLNYRGRTEAHDRGKGAAESTAVPLPKPAAAAATAAEKPAEPSKAKKQASFALPGAPAAAPANGRLKPSDVLSPRSRKAQAASNAKPKAAAGKAPKPGVVQLL